MGRYWEYVGKWMGEEEHQGNIDIWGLPLVTCVDLFVSLWAPSEMLRVFKDHFDELRISSDMRFCDQPGAGGCGTPLRRVTTCTPRVADIFDVP